MVGAMSEYSSAKSLLVCTTFFLVSTAACQNCDLEELRLEFRQLKLNNDILAVKVARLEELELKVQHLENVLMKQQNEDRTGYNAVQAELHRTTANYLLKQANQRNAIFRTCTELHQADPTLNSGMYWIDPDGQGVGDDPIYVECDMTTGKTSVLHDSESPTDVGHCADPGCYSRPIKYSASTRQMDALSELSNECHQSIRYDCNFAPLETNGAAFAWWNDRNGVAQYFWSGSNNSVHTCQCGIDHNCVELYNFCNCDSGVPVSLNDSGVITDKKYLPITRLNFGRTQLETSSGVHTLGRFECTGQVSVSGMPTSCSDLWKTGHTLSGFYAVRGAANIGMVYCDFTSLPNESGYQNLIGFIDVKSSPVYFHVLRGATFNTLNTSIPYDTEILNTGGAMNVSSGIFTALRKGTYSFAFSALAFFGLDIEGYSSLKFYLNGRAVNYAHAHGTTHDQISIHTTLNLQVGDRVWTEITAISPSSAILDGENNIHFTGWQLQEELDFLA